jgi:hypothetical protein
MRWLQEEKDLPTKGHEGTRKGPIPEVNAGCGFTTPENNLRGGTTPYIHHFAFIVSGELGHNCRIVRICAIR